MTKKIFIILIIVLGLFSMQKTHAMTVSDQIILPEAEKLETNIEIYEEGEWKDLEIDKYNKSNKIIYKLGNNKDKTSNITVSEQIEDIEIITILANGYSKMSPKQICVSNTNDAYIATKIALDCADKGISKDDIENYLRVKDGIDDSLKERAQNIKMAVRNLLSIKKENYFNGGFLIEQIGKAEQDEFNENYCSQKYKITTYNCILKEYSVSDYEDFVCEAFSTNDKGNKKDKYTPEEDSYVFRIAMPKEYREVAFDGSFKLNLKYAESKAYLGTNGNNRYIILEDTEKKDCFSISFINKKSCIYIKVNDKDKPREVIKDVKIKIKDENNLVDDTYTTDNRGSIFITSLGKGNVQMEILEIPENYTTEKSLYNKNLDYCDYCEYTISLKYKKGSLHINNNTKGAIFEIYDKNNKYIGTYQTNENGEVQIDEINIGEDYILKQTSVPAGYKLATDSKFSIAYNETTIIDIFNEKEINEPSKDEDEGNEKSPNEDYKKPNEENNNNEKNDNLTATIEPDDQDNVGGAITIPQKEQQKEENEKQEQSNKNHGETENNSTDSNLNNYDKEQDKSDSSKAELDDKQGEKEQTIYLEKNKNENIANEQDKLVDKNQENTLINKLPRTGYDFPEIKPMYIICIILIFLYILKRTAISQSK